MNKLFNAINSLFESEDPVVLAERGHKYIKDLPDDEIEDKGYSWAKAKVDDNGKKMSYGEAKKATEVRTFYDVIKHLEPTGYYFDVERASGYKNGIQVSLVKAGENKGTRLCYIFINVDDNDDVKATIEPLYHGGNDDIFNRTVTLKDVAQEIAKEKGQSLSDEFMIDNGAEIKARFEELKSQNTGTVEELLAKIEKQVNKIPAGQLLKNMKESTDEVTDGESKSDEIIDEAWSESTPNWLKSSLIKNNKDGSYWGPNYSSDLAFDTINSSEDLTNLRKLAKTAEEDNQLLFVRTDRGVYWYSNRRWRNINDKYDFLSTSEIQDRVKAAAITQNYDSTKQAMADTRKDRVDARAGSVDRYPDRSRHYSSEYDKSGYLINPNKYKDMLRKIKQDQLASSDTLNELINKNYVERFNELGRQAAEYIGKNTSITYNDDGSKYSDEVKFDFKAADLIKTKAQAAGTAIRTLMRKVDYVKTGNADSLRYGEEPETTNMEAWIKAQSDEVERKLDDFAAVMSKVEATNESVIAEDTVLKESDDSVVVMECSRSGYSASQVMNDSITVGELISVLEEFDSDSKIVTSHDNGYTYGPISSSDFKWGEEE